MQCAKFFRISASHDPFAADQANCLHGLAEINWKACFDPGLPLAERVIFPVSSTESSGTEGARLVRCGKDGGAATLDLRGLVAAFGPRHA